MTVVDNVTSSADSFYTNVTNYAASHSDGIVAILLLCGVVLTFSGRTLLKPTVFLIGSLPTTTTITVFGIALIADHHSSSASSPTSTVTKSKYTTLLEGLVIVFAITLGLLVGIVMVRLLCRVAIFIMCACCGCILICIVYFMLLQPANSHNTLLVWYAGMLITALITALLSVTYPNKSIIIGTSFDGAAISIYCMSYFLGHSPYLIVTSPNFTSTDNLIQHQLSIDSYWAATYAILTIILALFGAVTQQRVALSDHYISLYIKERKQQRNNDNGNDNDNDAESNNETFSVPMDNHYQQPLLADGTSGNEKYSLPYGSITPQYFFGHPNNLNDTSGVVLPPSAATNSNDQQLVTIFEPPRSPAYRQSSVGTTSYDTSTDQRDLQYSVIGNLPSDSLVPSVQPYTENGSISSNGKGPL